MRYIRLLTILILFSSCSHYCTQLFETKTTSPLKIENEAYIFENDTVKITYSFWSEKGTLSYNIYNKLNIPIYVDWKKSSYVRNGQKLDYWIDVATTNNVTTHQSSAAFGSLYGTSYNRSTTVKPQQIVFIAPKSAIKKDQFLLCTGIDVDFNKNSQTAVVPKRDMPNQTTVIKYIDYTPNSTLLLFRNFLTISTSDKFDKEFYVDNGFYISRISEMNTDYFWGDYGQTTVRERKKNNLKAPFESPKSFYKIR